jgi:hypothetical protein
VQISRIYARTQTDVSRRTLILVPRRRPFQVPADMRILVALLALVAPCTSFMHGSHAVSGLALRSPAAQLAAHRHSRVRRLVAPRAQAEIMSGLGDVVSGLLLAAEEVEKASFVPSAGGYSSASLYATLGLYRPTSLWPAVLKQKRQMARRGFCLSLSRRRSH